MGHSLGRLLGAKQTFPHTENHDRAVFLLGDYRPGTVIRRSMSGLLLSAMSGHPLGCEHETPATEGGASVRPGAILRRLTDERPFNRDRGHRQVKRGEHGALCPDELRTTRTQYEAEAVSVGVLSSSDSILQMTGGSTGVNARPGAPGLRR